MTNKDTVFFYKSRYLCFMLTDYTLAYGRGHSIELTGSRYFEWSGKIPKDLRPIGQRCILQWQ